MGAHQRMAVVGGAATLAALAHLPYLARPLSPDEAGFLMVAHQWSPGTSLYGDYWVDRPPLLIGLFQLADAGGGAVALRVMGMAAVALTVALAALVAHLLAPESRRAWVVAAGTAAVFLSTPMFGTYEVNGELLALPFVMAGLAAALAAARGDNRAAPYAVAAGAAAVAAVGVKQSMAEVFVAALVLAVHVARTAGWRRVAPFLGGFAAGATTAAVALLAWAASRGTDPAGLWDAVVTFRGRAAAVIDASATSATTERFEGLAGAFVTSGALALLLVLAWPGRRNVPSGSNGRWLAAAVLGWELFAIASGGSYWLHYLVGAVPGMVLATVVVVARRPARAQWLQAVLGYAAIVALLSVPSAASASASQSEVAVEQYLLAHARPGDTGVVAFGDPAILANSHLASPYPQLWSLPVRVRDPHLETLARILDGPDPPRWVVVDGGTLTTWGVDDTVAQPVLVRRYHLVHAEGDWHVWRLGTTRPPAGP